MLILGIDGGTKTGWCLYDGRKVVESGVEDFTKKRGESNGMMFLKFRAWMANFFGGLTGENKIGLVVYEQPHHRGGFATEICVNLVGRVQEEAERANVPYVAVHTASLKKWATGRGNADKQAMKAFAAKVLGRKPVDDNEADAVAIAIYGAELLLGVQR